MGIETYGGCCPRCRLQLLQKYDSCNQAFLFDACPHCGFAYGTGSREDGSHGEITPEEVWAAILEHHGVATREELIIKLNLSREPGTPETSDIWPSVFEHEVQAA